MDDSTEISDAELDEIEKAVSDYNSIVMRREIPRLVAALRSTRERAEKAEMAAVDAMCGMAKRLATIALRLNNVSDVCPEREHTPGHSKTCLPCFFHALKTLAHPTTEEPTP